jgi:acetate kinase
MVKPGAPTILVLNAGSSSLKGALVSTGPAAPPAPLATDQVAWGADASRVPDRTGRVRELIATLAATAWSVPAGSDAAPPIVAVGHRVVHGGIALTVPTRIDDEVVDAIRAVRDLAPLHTDAAVDAIVAAREALPDVPHVACFDTAFHATLPEHAWRYPLPAAWLERWGVRRFGFHGLSVEWATERTAALLGRQVADVDLVVAHLGSGCSVTAVSGGRSVATSMGWTPLEGLMMATRAGSVDPGILLRLLADGRLSPGEAAEALDHGSGLVAVAGTADMREVVARATAGEAAAGLALEMFASRAAAGIAATATSLRRVDAITFTGGIGERSAVVRAAIVGRLGVLGVAGPALDDPGAGDAVLSAGGAAVAVLRVEAREDLVIARETAALLG